MNGCTNAGGGSNKPNAQLTVTAPANTDVTAKLGSTSKVQNSGSDGSAVFKGLGQGSWNVSITNSEQTVTVPITITTDYSKTIAFFASNITVTYPSGSICTCTNTTITFGTVTYTASDTSGSYTFTVPRTGTWTVKCTNGSNMATQDVSITADGQSVSVTLSYWNGELFDNGNQYTDYTGGWTASNSLDGRYSVSPNLAMSGANITGIFRTNSKVDVTKYNLLRFTGKIATVAGGSQFGLSSNGSNFVSSVSSESITNGTVDISAVSGSYYIRIYMSAGIWEDGTHLSGNISISKVWME